MRIGKQDGAFTAIATSDADSITVRGRDLCRDLIGKIDFTDYFWLLVTGEPPSPAQRAVMNACLVAIAEHGLVPSVQAARMTLAAAPEAWQGAMAAGLLGMGTVVAGSSETAGRFLAEVLARADARGETLEAAAIESLNGLKAAKKKVPGLGHPQHSGGDPRADRLLAIADELGVSGRYVATLRCLGQHAPRPDGAPAARQRLGGDSRSHSRRRMAARSDQGGSTAGAHGGAGGAPLRGIPAADRVYPIPSGRPGHQL
jgi:citrate synthase